MKTKERIEIDNLMIDSHERAKRKLHTCFYPGCNEKSINSHILQKNGILTPLIEDNHLIQPEVDFRSRESNVFKRRGYKQAFSFACFCNEHDTELFRDIETYPIDFSVYKNRLRFLLRAKLNELYRKMVTKDVYTDCIQFSRSKANSELEFHFMQMKEQTELGIGDMKNDLETFWSDYFEDKKSFVIETRDIKFLPICLASFFDYETSIEIDNHFQETGDHLEALSSIFISLFPYNNESKLIMAYLIKNEKNVKSYVNAFLKESEKKLHRKITNLLSFSCETWVTSESFYRKSLEHCEDFFNLASKFSYHNTNERLTFDLNMFGAKFCDQVSRWEKDIRVSRYLD